MSSTGFNIEEVDSFKKYEGLEGRYIIDYYIRHKNLDSVYGSYSDLSEALDVMDDLELWDDYQVGYVTADGYPSFCIDL